MSESLARYLAEYLDDMETAGPYGVTGDVGDLEDTLAKALALWSTKMRDGKFTEQLNEAAMHIDAVVKTMEFAGCTGSCTFFKDGLPDCSRCSW